MIDQFLMANTLHSTTYILYIT